MSSESTIETRFAFESFVPIWTIILFGVVLLGLSWWLGRRDFRAAERSKLAWVLVLLRSIATLVVLWMLAGPTLVTITRIFQKKSIALLIDTSASMGLTDLPDGTGNVTRWTAAVRNGGEARRVQQFDSAIGMLVASSRELERFSALPESTAENAAARDLFSRAVKSIAKGLDLLTAATQGLPAADLSVAMVDATQGLKKGAAARLQSKATEFGRGKSLRSLQREQWLPAELGELDASIAALQRAADQFTTSVEEPIASANAATPNGSKSSRLERVEAFVREAEDSWLKELSATAIINRYQFGDKVVRADSIGSEKKSGSSAVKQALAPATHLGAALQQIALDSSARPLEAAILITDGGQNAGRDPREIAPSLRQTRLHIVPIGRTKMERDVILHHAQAPKAALQNDTVVIESVISAYGCEKEALQVELLDGETVVERQTVNVTSAVFDTNVQMRWKAVKTGKHTLTMRVAPLGKERSEENNSAKSDLTVMEERMRVLVADNFPRWETRYLINLFKRDERLSFDQLLFEPQAVTGESVRSNFPDSLEEWSKYRVIILGDVLPSQLRVDSQRLLHQYVSEMGGNLILVAGKDAMPAAFLNGPLGPLLPVQQAGRASSGAAPRYLHVPEEASQNLAIQIGDTPAGSQRIWREMSERLPIYSFSAFSQPKATTQTLIWAGKDKENVDLADPSTCSFLAWHYVGAGRVIYISAPLTYQLRYRTGDRFHHRFWGQLLRWAVGRELAEGSQTVRLSTDKLRYEVGDPLQLSAQLRQLDGKPVTDAAVEVEAWQEGKLLQKVVLKEDARRAGSYHALLPDLPAGVVKLQATGDRVGELLASEQYSRPVEVTVNIDPSAMVELRHALCNMPLLREIADGSRGVVLPPTALEAVMKELNLEPERSENITKKALWNRWDLFCLFIVCLSLEWAGRKYLGLS